MTHIAPGAASYEILLSRLVTSGLPFDNLTVNSGIRKQPATRGGEDSIVHPANAHFG